MNLARCLCARGLLTRPVVVQVIARSAGKVWQRAMGTRAGPQRAVATGRGASIRAATTAALPPTRAFSSTRRSRGPIVAVEETWRRQSLRIKTLRPAVSDTYLVKAMADCETQLIDGKAIAQDIRSELKTKIEALTAEGAPAPHLVVVIVGERPDSQMYVRMKQKACAEVGIRSTKIELPGTITEEAILGELDTLNNDDDVTSILVQLPLPGHLNEQVVLDRISLEKDVDGFHPHNVGELALRGRAPLATACTAKGCIEMLKRCELPIAGKRAVVIGRSNIVGMPVAMCLLNENATVSVCHSRTKDLESYVRNAEIIIAAVGIPNLVRGEWLSPGVVIIDVGMNKIDDDTRKRGWRWCGDVAFDEAQGIASHITPVPGGVGPMTVAMLLSNTYDAAVRQFQTE